MDETLKVLVGYVEASAEFAKEQAPLVASEILSYGVATNTLYGLLNLGTMVFILTLTWLYYKNFKKLWDIDTDLALVGGGLFVVIGGMILILVIVGFIDNVLTLAQIQFAPRLYILGELKGVL